MIQTNFLAIYGNCFCDHRWYILACEVLICSIFYSSCDCGCRSALNKGFARDRIFNRITIKKEKIFSKHSDLINDIDTILSLADQMLPIAVLDKIEDISHMHTFVLNNLS